MTFAACDNLPKKSTWNPYELHPVAQSPNGRPVPADNDIYYTKPGSYYGCSTINDAPSCVGG